MAKHDSTGQDDGRSIVSMRTMEIAIAAILLALARLSVQQLQAQFRWADDGPQSGFSRSM
jgi:hypothetical protein